jgi:hypothetical protein
MNVPFTYVDECCRTAVGVIRLRDKKETQTQHSSGDHSKA